MKYKAKIFYKTSTLKIKVAEIIQQDMVNKVVGTGENSIQIFDIFFEDDNYAVFCLIFSSEDSFETAIFPAKQILQSFIKGNYPLYIHEELDHCRVIGGF